jgi:3-oxoacyl-[acyl-carrier protein] reductase
MHSSSSSSSSSKTTTTTTTTTQDDDTTSQSSSSLFRRDAFRGKVVCVTGATGAIGRAVSKRFALLGASVVMLSRLSGLAMQAADSIRAEVAADANEELLGQLVPLACDVTNAAEVRHVFRGDAMMVPDGKGGKKRQLDVLVNAHGVLRDGLLLRLPEHAMRDVLDTNLLGSAYTCREAVRAMLMNTDSTGGGAIVNIGSIVGLRGNAGQVAYSMSKAGLVGLSASLAKEVGTRRIRCNVVAPGLIKSAMTEHMMTAEAEAEWKKNSNGAPLLWGNADDVVGPVVFLSSDAARHINGQVIDVERICD